MLLPRFYRYCLYGSCVIISTEFLYHTYYWLKRKLEERSLRKEICEVIWTNELTETCYANHPLFNDNKNVGRTNESSIAKLSKLFKPNTKCKNPFCEEKNKERIIEFIDAAKYSIDLAMYTFTSFDLSRAFTRAHQRGVLIRIISDHEMAFSTRSQIVPLTKKGIPIRCNRNTALMHHKFCILDCPRRVAEIFKRRNTKPNKGLAGGILLTGSLNWTNQGFSGNWENILITNNVEYIRKYSEEFERMWDSFGNKTEPDDKKCHLQIKEKESILF